MEPGEWIQERERMFQEYVWLFRELKEKMKETGVSDPFWEEVLEAVERFRGNYTCGYVQEMTMELLDALEKQEKEMKKEKAEDVPELPAKVQRLLNSCIEMQKKVRTDPKLAKVYSDVSFWSIINDIEAYHEQLKTAKCCSDKKKDQRSGVMAGPFFAVRTQDFTCFSLVCYLGT